jgi:hypothetical protein
MKTFEALEPACVQARVEPLRSHRKDRRLVEMIYVRHRFRRSCADLRRTDRQFPSVERPPRKQSRKLLLRHFRSCFLAINAASRLTSHRNGATAH